MKHVSFIATVILITTNAIAADKCKPTDWAPGADTAHCSLQIDGKTVTDGACRIDIAKDGRAFDIADMNSDTKAEVHQIPTRSDLPHALYGFWNRGSKSNSARMTNYGIVHTVDTGKKADAPWCWRNSRFSMCITGPYLICNEESEVPGEH